MVVVITLYLICWVIVPVTVGLALRSWWKSEPRWELPLWRSRLAFAAFSLGALSVVLWFVLLIWARVGGGFPFYDRVLLRCYGLGLLLGLGGFVLSLPSKGKLRWPACFISFAVVFMWIVTSSFE